MLAYIPASDCEWFAYNMYADITIIADITDKPLKINV